MPCASTYLFRLALPPLFALMRPPVPEGSYPRIHHLRAHRILEMLVTYPSLDTRCNRPSTIRRQLQMLKERVIADLPAAYRSLTEKAPDIIQLVLRRDKKEACLGEL